MVTPAFPRRPASAFVAVVMALALVARAPAHLEAHPLHTTISELTFDPAAKSVRLAIRVFNDDLAAAIAKRQGARSHSTAVVADAAALAYVRSTISLTGRDGRAIALASCGSRMMNDLLVLCIAATVPAGPSKLRLRQGMLLELFEDQVNVVQTLYGGRRRSMLFTRSSAAQVLP